MKLDENKVINIHTEGTKNVHAKFYSLWEQLLENKKKTWLNTSQLENCPNLFKGLVKVLIGWEH